MNLCCGVFCEFLGDFWVYLGGVVFLEGLVKLREIRNIEGLVKFYNGKLEFVVNN